ncbi:hypothetical protein TNCV_2393291 [Trichonephila clavipes]|nr:hypothetical protein TNCV_2393291 [Trichonephila clavipes]
MGTAQPHIQRKKLMLCIWLAKLAIVVFSVAAAERNHHWSSQPNTVDENEPALEEKRTHYYSRCEYDQDCCPA